MAANSGKTARGRGRPFEKGKSGNPSGRPKQTQEQKDALEIIRSLSPLAAERLREIITNDDVKVDAQLRAIEIILDRTYGKVHTVEVDASEEVLAKAREILGGVRSVIK